MGNRSKTFAAIVIATTAALTTGCGTSNNDPTPAETHQATTNMTHPTETTPHVWDESTIVQTMGLTPRDGSYTFQAADGTTCDVAVVMTTASQVAMYAEAGDVVATNPDATAGVKIVTEQTATCVKAATEKLATLK